MSIVGICNKLIEFSFYALFSLVPLIFWKDTSELYELNKMWLTFVLTIVIASTWLTKSIVSKKFYLQKTPLDIPIALFIISQIISTIFSWDPYVSFWGYYSRFNGGLLSTISYIILYYAFLSNFDLKTQAANMVKRLVMVSLGSGTLVALWGLPSHFGYDPTCLIFRGSFDVSCWTADFQPKIRIFSTLGQPAWLGAYLAILIPLIFSFFLNTERKIYRLGVTLLAVLFYIDLLFTRSRAALLGFWISIGFFVLYYFNFYVKTKIKSFNYPKLRPYFDSLMTVFLAFLILTVIVFNPIELNKGKVQKAPASPELQRGENVQTAAGSFSTGGGGTESGKIRLYVWQGALNAWLHNPIIGTGVETFAFAYYKYKPVGHNLTSEWNYLYNKAHNEYLNYLTTSGILGLGAYLFLIFTFFNSIKKSLNKKTDLLIAAFVAGYISILITNFFGFSVVIVNLYFFLIPAMVFILAGLINPEHQFVFPREKLKFKDVSSIKYHVSVIQWAYIGSIILTTLYLLLFLVRFWLADQAYSLGSNLIRAGEYSKSYSSLKKAVNSMGFEPTYKDELASNDAVFSVALLSNFPKDEKDQKTTLSFAEELAKEAIDYADEITRGHPNNVVFWKTKVRVFSMLAQVDSSYAKNAISVAKRVTELAPNDPSIYYHLGLLYSLSNDPKTIETFRKAIELKTTVGNNYNPRYALAAYYWKNGSTDKGNITNPDFVKKAVAEIKEILKTDPKNVDAKDFLELVLKFDPQNQQAKDALDLFQKN